MDLEQIEALTGVGEPGIEVTYVCDAPVPLAEAARRMMSKKIGCLVVTDKDDNAVGIITEADFLKWAVQLLDAFEAQLVD